MDSPKKTTRRRTPRLPVRLEGSLAGRVGRQVRLVDLSLTGCLVRCDALLDRGAILDLSLRLDHEPFVAKVRVIDSYLDGSSSPQEDRRYLASLEFLGLLLREQSSLRRFLEEETRRRRSATGP